MKDLSLKLKILLPVAALFALVTLMFGATLFVSQGQRKDGMVINLAGREWMLSLKMSKEALLHARLQTEGKSDQKQNAGASQINSAIQSLDRVIRQNAAASEEVASTSSELSRQAQRLMQAVGFFKTDF